MTKKSKVKTGFPNTREYGGNTYWLHEVYDTKRQANSIVRGLRQLGWNARLVKARAGWGVYERKRIE